MKCIAVLRHIHRRAQRCVILCNEKDSAQNENSYDVLRSELQDFVRIL
jgi:hypothetical protein